MTVRRRYHHGDLRDALVETALELIAEGGAAALSVAEAARRTGVSSAAPYRHFPNRESLFAAAAERSALALADAFEKAMARAEGPVEELAATAAAYVKFVVKRRAGFDVIFSEEIDARKEQGLAAAGRRLMDMMLEPALGITRGDGTAALTLLEHHFAAAHGYATLYQVGLLNRRGRSTDMVAAEAARVSRTLAEAAARAAHPER
ncbi:TetR/AcrR family transcriptional regulator [Corallococcus praedator]|uniref:TetR/AcrR family transcriptional regulator n=1 Tax=Corallococcus praedator TaxID=2316724 RepID=A0ABX9QA54_9BACT|nr:MULTISPECIES: TetR/AcrR family transcriptional regulator [Corallococcus]RKH21330.1 TetR/AcrR family transcriptional regulator [Corallococcus sp. CA031C]RKH93413.1 TetR/AcrR family transcriptional regulator [Corallococcus praedator]